MGQKTGIQRAVEMFEGSPTKLAAATDGKVLRQHIEHWLKAGNVPVEKCHFITAATGISCEQLNTEFDWDAHRRSIADRTPEPKAA